MTLRLPKSPGPAGCSIEGSGAAGLTRLALNRGPRGVVVVAVGRRHRLQKLLRPVGPCVRGQDGRHLNLGVEGDAGDFLLDEQGVVHPLAGLLDAVPQPAACGQGCGDAHSHDHGLPGLPGLHPQVAPQGGQGRHAQDGHRHAVRLRGLGLVGVGGVSPLLDGPLVGLLQVGLRPVGSHRAQHQPRHDALPLVEVGQRPHQGDEGVRAWVEQVVVPERCGAARTRGRRPAASCSTPAPPRPGAGGRPRRESPVSGPGGSGRRSGRAPPGLGGSGP